MRPFCLNRVLAAMTLCMNFLALGTTAQAVDISGAGATFPYPVYSKWADAYKKQTGVGLNDMPLKPDDLQQAGLVQFPMIIGGVVPVVNVKGVNPGALTLDGATLAAIYLGDVTKWNDPRIQKLNPKLTLPATAIAPVYRSDGSGTNFLFTDYLSKSSPKFKESIGANASVQWPTGIGAKGNEGIANMTTQTDGAVGYVEYAYAKQNKMAYALMINKAGAAVAPSAESFQTAASNADWAHADGYYLILTDQAGAKSWPITGASFILVYAEPPDAAATGEALKFFAWAYKTGGPMAAELDYVPLPTSLTAQVQSTWKAHIKSKGAPVWKGP